ncbi:hypothetical protein OG905_01140 [Streptomyces sp. NBC_00322]|uniref:hypothetical protein n=1 Tax=Streptomyces sp. NBC_00322 TaxID=2975712 RepID=UPI002E2C8F8C|nr:hypothetical protein [Streptomyces sp. NBC_00322]
MARSRRGLLVGAVVVVVASLLGLLVVLLTRHGGDTAAGEPKGNGRAPATDSHEQAQQVAAALEKLSTDPSSLVAAGARTEVKGRAAQGVPKGSKVTPEPATWAPDGAGGGVMTVTIASPGRPAVSYAAVMVNENGAWKVLATMKLPDARATTATPTAVAS